MRGVKRVCGGGGGGRGRGEKWLTEVIGAWGGGGGGRGRGEKWLTEVICTQRDTHTVSTLP